MSTLKQKKTIKADRFRSVDENEKILYTTNPEDFNCEEVKELRASGWKVQLIAE